MNLTFNKNTKPIFVDVETPFIHLEHDAVVDVILSPSYYWVKRVELPLKYLYEVKKLLPSLFDDLLLDDGKEYSYSAYKEDGNPYMAFAYQDSAIVDSLSKKGIKSSQINRVFFAQSEFSYLHAPLKIDENSVLALKDSIVIKLPSIMVGESNEIDLSAHYFSKHSISIQKYSHIIDKKTLNSVIALLSILILIYSVEIFILSSKIETINEKESSLFESNKLLSTTLQNEAILKKLSKTYDDQSRMREIIGIVLAHKVEKNEYLQNIEVKNKKVYATFKLESSDAIKPTHEKLKNAKVKTISNYNNGLLKLEMDI